LYACLIDRESVAWACIALMDRRAGIACALTRSAGIRAAHVENPGQSMAPLPDDQVMTLLHIARNQRCNVCHVSSMVHRFYKKQCRAVIKVKLKFFRLSIESM